MNLITGLICDADSPRFQSENLDLKLPAEAVPRAAVGRDVCLGVRSEHVLLGPDGAAGGVQLTEPLGDETLVFFDYGGPSQVVAKYRGDRTFNVGEGIKFDFDPKGVLVFDAEDGTRLE